MLKSKIAPLLLIIVAVALAGGVALYLSQRGSTSAALETSRDGATTQAGRIRGAANAPVTLTEYGDFQCPTCGRYHPILTELLTRYAGKLKIEYHHFPLIQIHPNALEAALAAESAADQGKFWEMHDLLYEHQSQWAPSPKAETLFLQYALELGLDSNKFMQSMRAPATRDRVVADVTKGSSIVQGTPTFLINGQQITDLPGLEGLAERIDRQLATHPK